MNREMHYAGWLVKSPPTKRIWRARWRRRWFTLKQGEFPGQYFLEYYTDKSCKKLKGTIDLDQCEQVDAGLCMERKFQHVFNVKTPNRIYYLAADSDEDMRFWVNCICKVCGLQDLSKVTDERQYFNVGPGSIEEAPLPLDVTDVSNRNTQKSATRSISTSFEDRTYQNDDIFAKKLERQQMQKAAADAMESYYNFSAIRAEVEASEAKPRATQAVAAAATADVPPKHSRSQSLNEMTHRAAVATGAVKKIPENLKLTDVSQSLGDCSEPSPSLSTCSGPYIPISECFSGSPVLLGETPATPLNSLDPRFYDTPRSHINIGLNLTDEQPYSPKRNNCTANRSRSGRSSPSDSESVFTDDEWTTAHHDAQTQSLDRRARPSDSSVENETIGWTYVQRFSKVPDDVRNQNATSEAVDIVPPRPPKRLSGLVLDGVEIRNKEVPSSDTDNASPAIGPKDSSCDVEESYDIPRSHWMPYFSGQRNNSTLASPKLLTTTPDILASTRTPDVVSQVEKIVNNSHYYTNAAPVRVEGNVFRYDFMEQSEAPAVNRNLKPRLSSEATAAAEPVAHAAPNVDRKLKPTTPKLDTKSLPRRKEVAVAPKLRPSAAPSAGNATVVEGGSDEDITPTCEQPPALVKTLRNDDKLQYLDLDHSSTPQRQPPRKLSASSIGNLFTIQRPPEVAAEAATGGSERGIVYKTVDFVKTEAFKMVRQDAEMSRAANRSKD
ncbi:protein daughter of sevenless [Lutzomyia longipalpis]|uniref:protein daughter of sevenless n=1 Tax=Lutzomyia longipalpis TaxID=7200 RepID=UPI002483472C|nr:protein daughter of sevenless [Lutzomyia longipalpis]